MRGKTNFVIGVNQWHSNTRQRFTISHELGRYFFHGFDDIQVDKAFKFRSPLSAKAIDIEEIAANTFVASLLIPERMVLTDIRNSSGIGLNDDETLKALAATYDVSQQSMSFRVLNLLSRLRIVF